jgi:hypothetical protein
VSEDWGLECERVKGGDINGRCVQHVVNDELDEEGGLQVVDGLCPRVLGSDDDICHAYEPGYQKWSNGR